MHFANATLGSRLLDRERWFVAAAAAAGLLARVAYGSTLPRPELYGDEHWYVRAAESVLGVGPAWEPYVRAPGTTWWTALVFWLRDGRDLDAVLVANAVLAAVGILLAAGIARRLLPAHRWAPPLVAWVHAGSPSELHSNALVASESLYIPLTLLCVWLWLRGREGLGRKAAVALGVAGAALLHARADCLPLVLLWTVLGAVAARRTPQPGGARRWIAAGGLALALCVPWSLHVSAQIGRPTFMADPLGFSYFHHRRGLLTWMTGVSMRRAEWLQIAFYGPGRFPLDAIPESAYDTAEEATRVRAALLAARDHAWPPEKVDAELERLGRERLARNPLRFHLGLPLERSARIWLDVTDNDTPPALGGPPPTFVQRLIRAWAVTYRVLTALGFLLAFPFAWRWRTAGGLIAATVLVRTYSLVFGLAWLARIGVAEGRFMRNVEPLALVLVAAAAAEVIARYRAARARRAA